MAGVIDANTPNPRHGPGVTAFMRRVNLLKNQQRRANYEDTGNIHIQTGYTHEQQGKMARFYVQENLWQARFSFFMSHALMARLEDLRNLNLLMLYTKRYVNAVTKVLKTIECFCFNLCV